MGQIFMFVKIKTLETILYEKYKSKIKCIWNLSNIVKKFLIIHLEYKEFFSFKFLLYMNMSGSSIQKQGVIVVREVIIKKKNESMDFVQRGREGVRPQIQTFLDVILAIMKISSRFIWTLKTFPHSGSWPNTRTSMKFLNSKVKF